MSVRPSFMTIISLRAFRSTSEHFYHLSCLVQKFSFMMSIELTLLWCHIQTLRHPGSLTKVSRMAEPGATELDMASNWPTHRLMPFFGRPSGLNLLVGKFLASLCIQCRVAWSKGRPWTDQSVRLWPPRLTLPMIPFRSLSSGPKQILPWKNKT